MLPPDAGPQTRSNRTACRGSATAPRLHRRGVVPPATGTVSSTAHPETWGTCSRWSSPAEAPPWPLRSKSASLLLPEFNQSRPTDSWAGRKKVNRTALVSRKCVILELCIERTRTRISMLRASG